MSHQKRQQAFRNSKLSPNQGEKVRVLVDFGPIRRGDGKNGLIEDVIEAYDLGMKQFYMETAGMECVGTVRIDLQQKVYIESARVQLDRPKAERRPQALTRSTEDSARIRVKSGAGLHPEEPGDRQHETEPELELEPDQEPAGPYDPARREQALQQALKLLEDFRDDALTYREDIMARVEASVWPELVFGIVTQVERKFVTKMSGEDIRWKDVRRIPKVVPTREQLELTGHIRSLKMDGKGTVKIRVHDVVSKQHEEAVHALRARGTGPLPLGYSTEAVYKRLSLFGSTPHLLRFKGTAARGLLAGDRFEFLVTSVELADADDAVLAAIAQDWHEQLHRK